MSSSASEHESGRLRGASRVLIIVQNVSCTVRLRVWLSARPSFRRATALL